MYTPLLSSHEPSNRERRIASIESIAGFMSAVWLVVDMPHGLAAFLSALAAVLLLFGHGAAVLTRSKNPLQMALWPEFAHRMGSGREESLLDERDLSLRCRAFVVSYQILSLVIFATFLAFDLLLPRIVGSAPHKWIRLHDLMLILLSLLIFLLPMLPCWVLPWLEKDASEDEDLRRHVGQSLVNEQSGKPELFPKWIRIAGSLWVVWGICALLMMWVFHRYMPR
jgi:hypothetical protein